MIDLVYYQIEITLSNGTELILERFPDEEERDAVLKNAQWAWEKGITPIKIGHTSVASEYLASLRAIDGRNWAWHSPSIAQLLKDIGLGFSHHWDGKQCSVACAGFTQKEVEQRLRQIDPKYKVRNISTHIGKLKDNEIIFGEFEIDL